MEIIEGGVCAAKGFTAGGIHAGIKKDPTQKDLAMIYCETRCNTAALFTTSRVKAAPILHSMDNVSNGIAQAVIVNSGNANACTKNGRIIAERMCNLTADSLGIFTKDIIVASTGVIGQKLSADPFEKSIPILAEELSKSGNDSAVEAIMTTDTFPKQYAVEFTLGGKPCRIGGIAKGSGMIHPDMATMLAFITTDANIDPTLLKGALLKNNYKTFNMLSVDGDTSTNDMVCIMASGLAGNDDFIFRSVDYQNFTYALFEVMKNLTKQMARDGEGATKLIKCTVTHAPDETTAELIAKSVVSSNLVKAAIGAADANWGRVICAVGYTKVIIDPKKIDIHFMSEKGKIAVCLNGAGVPFSEEEATDILSEEEVSILINLHSGGRRAAAYGCDLTEEYVRINADYRS
ncbi:MAG: bifunctional glutamate N-acetyltransferase/amino-acid acetyltransferase ArgJ [Oscillospiraceae bacterium]|nr:bifunctional glutamate N-acetyltransferase/amino-acid acetyltransferase ArgJ [Oscillospiraceae bacterium]